MDRLSRRSMLRRSYGLAGAAPTALPAGYSQARAKRPESDRKLRVVAVGGHFDDPQTCAGGTLTLFADQGHDVVALSITGGPPPSPDRNPEEREVKNRLNAMKMAEILKIRLVCMNYQGSSSGAYGPLVYRSGSEVTGERYKEFTEFLLDGYNPDIVIAHWPIEANSHARSLGINTVEKYGAQIRRLDGRSPYTAGLP